MDELEAQEEPLISFGVGEVQDGTLLVTVSGELDISNADTLDQAVSPVLAQRPNRLIVDVRGLRFADSSAIALWVRWAAKVDEFELRDPPELLRRVVTSMGLAGKLELAP